GDILAITKLAKPVVWKFTQFSRVASFFCIIFMRKSFDRLMFFVMEEKMIDIFQINEKFTTAKELVKKVYLSDERPWVVGFSGGKDSTAVVQLIFSALSELDRSQLKKMVYVISSDTLV